MFNMVVCELLKLKRSKMLWLLLIGALLPALLDFFVAVHKAESNAYIPWDELFKNNLLLMTMLMSPAIFTLFGGYLFAREYQERTINNYLTSPVPRIQLLISKHIVMLPVIFIMLLMAFALTLVSGYMLKHDVLTSAVLLHYIKEYLLLMVIEFVLTPIAATVSILGKSYIPAMALGIFAVISELTIMQSKYIMYYPWSAPLNLVLDVSHQYNNAAVGIITLAAACIIPMLFNIIYYRWADVHSG